MGTFVVKDVFFLKAGPFWAVGEPTGLKGSVYAGDHITLALWSPLTLYLCIYYISRIVTVATANC